MDQVSPLPVVGDFLNFLACIFFGFVLWDFLISEDFIFEVTEAKRSRKDGDINDYLFSLTCLVLYICLGNFFIAAYFYRNPTTILVHRTMFYRKQTRPTIESAIKQCVRKIQKIRTCHEAANQSA